MDNPPMCKINLVKGEHIMDFITNAWNAIVAFFTNAWNTVYNFFVNLF